MKTLKLREVLSFLLWEQRFYCPLKHTVLDGCHLFSFFLLSLKNTCCDQVYAKVIINDLKKEKKRELTVL